MARVRRISVRARFYNAASKATQPLTHFSALKTISLLRILQKPLGQFLAPYPRVGACTAEQLQGAASSTPGPVSFAPALGSAALCQHAPKASSGSFALQATHLAEDLLF